MLVLLWGVATIGMTWTLAWHIGSQAAIAGSIVMTVAVVGVLTIYSILVRSNGRPSSSAR